MLSNNSTCANQADVVATSGGAKDVGGNTGRGARGERVSSQRGKGKKNSLKVVRLTGGSASRTREKHLSSSSARSASKREKSASGGSRVGARKITNESRGGDVHSSLNLVR